jgi:hypothetical protein
MSVDDLWQLWAGPTAEWTRPAGSLPPTSSSFLPLNRVENLSPAMGRESIPRTESGID